MLKYISHSFYFKSDLYHNPLLLLRGLVNLFILVTSLPRNDDGRVLGNCTRSVTNNGFL